METNFSLKQLQAENAVWVTKNFGDKRDPFAGMVEECGELAEAVEALADYSRGAAALRRLEHFDLDTVLKETRDLVADAAADAVVFMADFCNMYEFDLEWAIDSVRRTTFDRVDFAAGMSLLGKIAHAKLKLLQGIRGSDDHHRREIMRHTGRLYLWVEAMLFSSLFGSTVGSGIIGTPDSFLQIIEHVWSQVRQRDWTKNKTTGS